MWREGFDLALMAWTLNALTLLVWMAAGVQAFFYPKWAAHFVRLKADDARPGGFAEFRATYGGFFAALHGAGAGVSLFWLWKGDAIMGLYATGAAFALSAAWMGAAAARAVSMWRDGTWTKFNLYSAAVEAGTALLIAAPWLVWALERPG